MKLQYIRDNSIPLLLTSIIALQNPMWLFFNISDILSFVLILLLYYELSKKKELHIKWNPIIFFGLALVFIFLPLFRGFHVSNIFYLAIAAMAPTIKTEYYIKALYFLKNYLFYIILVSLPLWLIHVYITPIIPSIGIIDLTSTKGSNYDYYFENHIFYLIMEGFDFYRFYSVFDEPGVLGTLGALVLVADRMRLSNLKNIVITLGCFFTYSLAFYILFIIGFIAFGFSNLKRIKTNVVIILLFILVIPYVLTNETFIRVVMPKFSTDTSEMVNSRIDGDINKYFENNLISSSMFWGIGSAGIEEMKIPLRTSYKLTIIEYGWIAMFFLLLYYNSLIRKRNKDSYIVLLLFILSFLQRPFLWTSWEIILFKMVTDSLWHESHLLITRKV